MNPGAVQLRLPAPKQVRDFLDDALGREVALRSAPPFGVSTFSPASVATYVDDSLTVRAVVALDLPLSAHVGAALALVPVGAAKAAIEDGRLTGTLAQHVEDLCLKLAALLVVPGSARLRLYTVQVSGEPIPADAQARTQVLGRRLDFALDVTGYGSGRIALVLT